MSEAEQTQQRLSELSLLTGAEEAQLAAWNATAAAYPSETCIHTLFEEQAARTPDAVAVEYAQQHLTYAELNARANQLAWHLRHAGLVLMWDQQVMMPPAGGPARARSRASTCRSS